MSSVESFNEMTWITLSSADHDDAESYHNEKEVQETERVVERQQGGEERRRRRLLRLLCFRPGAIVSKWKSSRGGDAVKDQSSAENTFDSDDHNDKNNHARVDDIMNDSKSSRDAPRNGVLEYEGKHRNFSCLICIDKTTPSLDYSSPKLPSHSFILDLYVYKVTCPLGLSEGNTLFVQSPSNVRQFYASVPAGKLAGDVFRVHYYPPPDKNGGSDDSESFLEDSEFLPCAHPSIVREEQERHRENDATTASSMEKSGWKVWSSAVDDWLTPTPRIVGRPVNSP